MYVFLFMSVNVTSRYIQQDINQEGNKRGVKHRNMKNRSKWITDVTEGCITRCLCISHETHVSFLQGNEGRKRRKEVKETKDTRIESNKITPNDTFVFHPGFLLWTKDWLLLKIFKGIYSFLFWWWIKSQITVKKDVKRRVKRTSIRRFTHFLAPVTELIERNDSIIVCVHQLEYLLNMINGWRCFYSR